MCIFSKYDGNWNENSEQEYIKDETLVSSLHSIWIF